MGFLRDNERHSHLSRALGLRMVARYAFIFLKIPRKVIKEHLR
jgi:hypothetical protein